MSLKTKLGVAVIGLGPFGCKRVNAIASDPESRLCAVADVVNERAQSVGTTYGCDHTAKWRDLLLRDDVNVVIVSTPTQFLSEITLAALQAGKHVLCEKPFGRNAAEVLPAVEAAERKHLCLKVGYNHRYHPGIARAHDLFHTGAIGRLQFLRCAYGHGGRPGYDREWRAQRQFSGGGQLLDQGVHVLDLFRWFAGEFSEVKSYASTAFWPIAPVEDNVFALLRNDAGCTASLHASWTNWKNTFRFELFGELGYLMVSGLGGHYGTERLVWGKRHEAGATPEEQSFEFPGVDQSLEREWQDFGDCIREERAPQSDGRDAWKTLLLAESIYRDACTGGTLHTIPDTVISKTGHGAIFKMPSISTDVEPSTAKQSTGETLR